MKKRQKELIQMEVELYDIIIALESVPEARRFFRDLLTQEEIDEFARRWKTARLLDQKFPYSYISSFTGLSSTTIARVSKWLKGEGGGYRTMIARRPKYNYHPHRSKHALESGS